ncbi:biotin/lipoyl-containing protein, partial [Oryzihumus leptocrescens]
MGDFVMPSLGADMDEGTLLEWLVRPGEPVSAGQVVAVVDTAKSAVEVEAFESGVMGEQVVGPGTKVPVGAPLAR